jgi:hypothetical protein
MKKVWYPVNELQNKVGFVVDVFDEYTEIQDEETGNTKIVETRLLIPLVNEKIDENYIEL